MRRLQVLLTTLRSGQFWRLFPHRFYRWRRARQIDATAPVRSAAPDDPGALHVSVMTGRKQQFDALFAIKSFARHFGAPVSFSLLCDQSVDAPTLARLRRHLPDARLWTREERDRLVEPQLLERGLVRCAAFRRVNLFAPKLIDIFLLTTARRVLLMDTDCLSFRPLETLRELASSETLQAAFGGDPLPEPYALPAATLDRCFGRPVARHLNAGFALVDRSLVDLSRIERWLAQGHFADDHFHGEQALWAGLAGDGHHVLLPPAEYNMGRIGHDESDCALVHYCGHYLSATRLAMQTVGQRLVLETLRAPTPRQPPKA